jgi:hypothetical protein
MSADTAERGFKELKEHGLLQVRTDYRAEPLVAGGIAKFNRYELLAPFDQQAWFLR